MKILNPVRIFLDITGVMTNSDQQMAEYSLGNTRVSGGDWDRTSVGMINILCETLSKIYRPEVVITSTLRGIPDARATFAKIFTMHGASHVNVVGITPVGDSRPNEVATWLSLNGWSPYVCIDDSPYYEGTSHPTVLVGEEGFRSRHVQEALGLIKRQEMQPISPW